MKGDEKNVVLVMYQYSVVVKGVENKLKELGYNIELVSENYDRIKKLTEENALFIIYLPRDILDVQNNISTLRHIADMVREAKRNLMLIGEAKLKDDVLKAVPSVSGFEWVDRPVNMETFGDCVDRAISARQTETVRKRILIVDDDPSYARMVREWIKDNYRVDIVTTGMQAISFLLKVNENEKVDLILLDYEMPVVDGPQVLQMLRQEPATAHIPVFFLTGNGSKEAVSRVMELRPDGYILKSTTREDLLLNLQRKLG